MSHKEAIMLEMFGNMLHMECDALCVTTNGFVKANGECVMGRGIALEIKKLFPEVPKKLGTLVKKNGNVTQVILPASNLTNKITLVAVPTKPVSGFCNGSNTIWPYPLNAFVPGFHMQSQIDLIIKSINQLVDLTDQHGWERVLLPRVGCGNGGLNWDEVKPVIEPYLDDRFIVCHFA